MRQRMTEDTPPPPHPCSIGERNPSARFAGTSHFRGGFWDGGSST